MAQQCLYAGRHAGAVPASIVVKTTCEEEAELMVGIGLMFVDVDLGSILAE